MTDAKLREAARADFEKRKGDMSTYRASRPTKTVLESRRSQNLRWAVI